MRSMVQKVYYSQDLLEKKPHFHDCHQIVLILEGTVEFGIHGENIRAGASDAVVFSRYENHAVHVLTEPYTRYVLHIDPDVVYSDSCVYSLLTDRPSGFCNVISLSHCFEHVVRIFELLQQEQGQGEQLSNEMENSLIKQLLIILYRHVSAQFAMAADEMIIDIKQLFERNYSQTYSLKMLAKRYNVSVSALSHRFRAATGMSVMNYLFSCRMASAKRLLATTDMDIGQIVDNCGFSDSNNFARSFKRLNGITPSAFRASYKQ